MHPLITFPAVPHHHGLLIQLTPVTLPVGIKRLCTYVCLHGLVWLPVTVTEYVWFLYIVLFFACWHFRSLIKSLTCNWTQISIFPLASSLSRDRYQQQTWVQQGGFFTFGRETSASRIMPIILRGRGSPVIFGRDLPHNFFGGGLAEPFKSGMPYWLPGESLE